MGAGAELGGECTGGTGFVKLARQLLPTLLASLVSGETTHGRRDGLKFRKSLAGKERHRRGQAVGRDSGVRALSNPRPRLWCQQPSGWA